MKLLVTGGSGFLGRAVCERLKARGDQVMSLARHHSSALAALGIRQLLGDVADRDAVMAATRGVDGVIHTAAKAGVFGPLSAYFKANVTGTQNVLDACALHRIRHLVHTSSPSVVFAGTDQEGVDETAPYPRRFLSPYPQTKAEAERRVLAANDDLLGTVALRPHLIWGPGDPHLVPRVVGLARAGQLRFVGSGTKLVDCVFIDNAADAHLAALDALAAGAPVAGKAYFVTNAEPWPLADVLNGILAAAGLPAVRRRVSPRAAWLAGAALEGLHSLLGREDEPRMTRFVARQLATAHWYDPRAAREELGYAPAVSMREGMARLTRDFAARNP